MNPSRFHPFVLAGTLLLASTLCAAASVSGVVTNKTTGKPASGDPVAMLDVQAGMSEIGHATTDAHGHYTLNPPGAGPYLIRVTHQGAGYFIAVPPGGGSGDIPVYDVAAKVDGVFIEALIYEIEADNGQLHVNERYLVQNTSTPPRTMWTPKSFEITLPVDSTVAGVAAQRPTGLPTSVRLDPTGTKGHYTFNFPIEPSQGDKTTLFQVEYTLPYAGSRFTFHPSVSLPTQSVGILMPKSMGFKAGASSVFQPLQQDPNLQTYVARNAAPGKALEFTVTGTGSMPRDAQQTGGQGGQQPAGATQSTPGGGIGTPINTPDPLSKYKWWILGTLALLLSAGAALLLRRAPGMAAAADGVTAVTGFGGRGASPAARNTALLNALKEELFAIESEKLNGTLSADEYARIKPALELVLKRALKRSGPVAASR